jgi:hypothetical protein
MGKVERQLVTPLKKILAALNKLLLTPEEVAPVI